MKIVQIIIYVLTATILILGAYLSYNYLYRQTKINSTEVVPIQDSPSTSQPFAFSQSDTFESFVKPSDEVLQQELTKIQYYVTQEEGTEIPFENAYWDNHQDGIYVDLISGEPLFSSNDKFDSGTGWPSFLKPIEEGVVTEHDDFKLVFKRIEIRSRYGDNHIGHIIKDGPLDNKGIRYCMNSAAMHFIPADDLVENGYGRYANLFN